MARPIGVPRFRTLIVGHRRGRLAERRRPDPRLAAAARGPRHARATRIHPSAPARLDQDRDPSDRLGKWYIRDRAGLTHRIVCWNATGPRRRLHDPGRALRRRETRRAVQSVEVRVRDAGPIGRTGTDAPRARVVLRPAASSVESIAQRHPGDATLPRRAPRARRAAAARSSRQSSSVFAIRQLSPRPAIERALQLPRRAVQRAERGIDRERRRRRATPSGRRADRRSPLRRARPRRSTRTSRRPRPDRSDPRRRRRAARAPAAIASAAAAAAAGGRAARSSVLELEPVRLTDRRQVIAEPRPLLLPGADADVDVVALREDPAVAAGDVGELDHRAPRVAVARSGSCTERCPPARRRGRSRRPSPTALAVVPFAPSAPTTTSTSTARRRSASARRARPARPREPRHRRCGPASSRNASRRRRCVMRITGALRVRSTGSP